MARHRAGPEGARGGCGETRQGVNRSRRSLPLVSFRFVRFVRFVRLFGPSVRSFGPFIGPMVRSCLFIRSSPSRGGFTVEVYTRFSTRSAVGGGRRDFETFFFFFFEVQRGGLRVGFSGMDDGTDSVYPTPQLHSVLVHKTPKALRL